MARPVWTNEIIGDIDDDYDPQFDIEVNGTTVLSGAKIKLKNAITQEGTRHNADNMNNMFDFDNMDAMRSNKKDTIFNSNGSITEEIRNISSNILNAKRVTTFSNNNINEVTTIYTDDGLHVLRSTAVSTTIEPNGNVREEVI